MHWLESVQGLPTPRQLANLSDRFRDHRAYVCGPRPPFMDAIHESLALAGVPRDRVHAEVFTSLSGDPFADVVVEEVPDTGAGTASTSRCNSTAKRTT